MCKKISPGSFTICSQIINIWYICISRIWHQITCKGWCAIKPKPKNHLSVGLSIRCLFWNSYIRVYVCVWVCVCVNIRICVCVYVFSSFPFFLLTNSFLRFFSFFRNYLSLPPFMNASRVLREKWLLIPFCQKHNLPFHKWNIFFLEKVKDSGNDELMAV